MKKPLRPPIHRGISRPPDPGALDRLAGAALGYLAAESERLGRFFAVTGLSVETLRDAADSPAFIAHLLDYMASDERRLLAFAAETGHEPAAIEAMRLAINSRAGGP